MPTPRLGEALTLAEQLTDGTLAHTYSYWYDAAGNRTNVTVDGTASYETTNNVNQLTNKTPSTLLTYDAQGNELSRSNSASLLQMGYDGANRCTTITNGTLTTQIQYDGFNHWVRITDYNGATLTYDRRFIWNGNTLAEERDATGTNVVKRFFSNGFQQNGTNYYYLKDNLGSICEVTDANGNVVARFAYDPYGNRTQTFGTLQVDYGFAGLFEHAQSGLKFAVYRFYDSTTGRWINRDPIGEQGGWNLYAYCGGDPVNWVDGSGLILAIEPGTSPANEALIVNTLNQLAKSDYALTILQTLASSTATYYINISSEDSFSPKPNSAQSTIQPGGIIRWNPKLSVRIQTSKCSQALASPVITLAHELGHAYDNASNLKEYVKRDLTKLRNAPEFSAFYTLGFPNLEEVYNVYHNERRIEHELQLPERYSYHLLP